MNVCRPLIFVFHKADRRLGICQEDHLKEQPKQEQEFKIPDKNAHNNQLTIGNRQLTMGVVLIVCDPTDINSQLAIDNG